jgi:hypothetical protein
MVGELSSRERMLAAINCQVPDYVPCSFMIFRALQNRCRDQAEFVENQLELGLDACVELPAHPARDYRAKSEHPDLHGLPVRFDPAVEVRDWREDLPGEPYPVIHRQYRTPVGTLRTCVNKTEDWVQGDRVPLFDDYVVPRARERLVKGAQDLPALRYLLTPPSDADVAAFRQSSRAAKEVAARHDLLVAGIWGSLFDTACWLCGMQELVLMAIDTPEVLEELLRVIGEWNRRRMEVILDEGVDLFIRRAWYETVDFLSPALYRRFILPHLKADVQLAHQAGARLACITTSAYTPLLDLYLESGMDALIGPDPVQDARADFALTKRKLAGRICIWGGVNTFVTIERGKPEAVRAAVQEAVRVLAPGGGFILSPVDNVREDNAHTWANVRELVSAWRACRRYPIQA